MQGSERGPTSPPPSSCLLSAWQGVGWRAPPQGLKGLLLPWQMAGPGVGCLAYACASLAECPPCNHHSSISGPCHHSLLIDVCSWSAPLLATSMILQTSLRQLILLATAKGDYAWKGAHRAVSVVNSSRWGRAYIKVEMLVTSCMALGRGLEVAGAWASTACCKASTTTCNHTGMRLQIEVCKYSFA